MNHKHNHTREITQKVILAQYRQENGQIRYVETVGYDILKKRACSCGDIITVDLERHML